MKLVTDWNALSAAIATLPDDEAGKLFRFVAAYINGEEVAADNSVAWLTFGIVKCSLDKALHVKQVRSVSGALGGAPVGNTNAKKENKQKQAKTSKNKQTDSPEKQAKTSKNKQKQAKDEPPENQTFTDEKTPKNAEKTPKNDYTDNNIYNTDIYNNSDIEDSDTMVVGSVGAAEKIDVKKFAEFFNAEMDAHNAVIPRITCIEGKRKQAVCARLREKGKTALGMVVRNAAKSDFLNGKNNRAWVASFDWIFKPSNFVKVLDGNYANHDLPSQNASSVGGMYVQPNGGKLSGAGQTLNSLATLLMTSENGNDTDFGGDNTSTVG